MVNSNYQLISNDELTQLLRSRGILSWDAFRNYVMQIPYGRNVNRTDLKLVITENKGTCSSKHALVKVLADLNGIKYIKLILGIYKMDAKNTPGIGNHITDHGLMYIPEAHCYLNCNNIRIDITNPESDIARFKNDILVELEIESHQVGEFKVAYHRDFLRQWILDNEIDKTLDEIWSIREKCIEELSKVK